MSKLDCVACHRTIDAAAKMCPYCGADPKTGEKIVDAAAILQEEFKPRRVTASESVLQYARQRQGIVVAGSVIIAFIVLALVHQYVTMRNQTAVSTAPAVLLSEVTDLSTPPDEGKPQPLPDLKFQYEGHPQAMRSYIVEPGAVVPPEVLAAQQAAAQAAAMARQQPTAANSAQPRVAGPQPPAAAPRPATVAPPAVAPAPAPPPV